MPEHDEKTRVTKIQTLPSFAERRNDCLVVIYTKEPALLGKRFVLEHSPTRIGRGADNQIILDGDSVSRRHAHLKRRKHEWCLVDDDSTNGTYLNDELAMRATILTNGDRLKIGSTIFKFLSGADVESQYHEEIYRMTIVDGLTQVHNKRYFFDALEREVVRARRHGRDLSVLMFDIDHFKQVNDKHGHLAGDFILKELVRVVEGRIRRDEILARYGGEEFAIVLPETNLEGALSLGESIRHRVFSTRFNFQGEIIPISISLGAASLVDSDRNAAELIQRADEQLYSAKRGGRNQVSG